MYQKEEYLDSLKNLFESLANKEIAAGQSAYLKDLFDFYGIKAPIRQEMEKPFLAKDMRPSKSEVKEIILFCWKQPQREYQHFAQDLLEKYTKDFEISDLELLEHIITHKSWWDTVDFIAPKLVGEYFKLFPEKRDQTIEKWLNSGNIWLQRSCLIFQLKYKNNLNSECLHDVIIALLGSKEFFINKAIGWILREYAKTNPEWVIDFVNQYGDRMANLSKREALRRIL